MGLFMFAYGSRNHDDRTAANDGGAEGGRVPLITAVLIRLDNRDIPQILDEMISVNVDLQRVDDQNMST